jgi:hypothetical protein
MMIQKQIYQVFDLIDTDRVDFGKQVNTRLLCTYFEQRRVVIQIKIIEAKSHFSVDFL